MIDQQRLIALAAEKGVTVTAEQAEKLDRYAELLVDWNTRMNLTAVTDPEGILVKHFIDSLTLLTVLPDNTQTLIDVGTGAGFPGIPAAIVRPSLRLTLLDSLNKRLVFLQEVCTQLGIQAELIHARAEEGGRQPSLRESFDAATARAVAALPVLAEYCMPFVKVGGVFVAMKGPSGEQELQEAASMLRLLGGGKPSVTSLTLPMVEGEAGSRTLITVPKTKNTPAAYPRHGSKISKPRA